MDWSRAKTFLILAFLFLDIFLGFRILARESEQQWVEAPPPTVGAPEDRLVELNRRGITSNVAIPLESPLMTFLRVQPQRADARELRERFFPGDVEVESQEYQGATIYTTGEEQLQVWDPGLISYQWEGPVDQSATIRPEEARPLVEKFFERLGGLPPDARFERVEAGPDDGYVVFYGQDYNGRPLFRGGDIHAEIRGGRVVQLDIRWLEVIETSGAPRRIISAYDALLSLREERPEGPEGNLVVEDIQLGYDATGRKLFADWEVQPVWGIRTSDGEWHYVNAYTGVVEESDGVEGVTEE